MIMLEDLRKWMPACLTPGLWCVWMEEHFTGVHTSRGACFVFIGILVAAHAHTMLILYKCTLYKGFEVPLYTVAIIISVGCSNKWTKAWPRNGGLHSTHSSH